MKIIIVKCTWNDIYFILLLSCADIHFSPRNADFCKILIIGQFNIAHVIIILVEITHQIEWTPYNSDFVEKIVFFNILGNG